VGRDVRAGLCGETDLREIILWAQDNLTNVLATVLGIGVGSGSTKIVALAGLASGIAEAISMGGVLYTSTCAERDLQRRVNGHEEGTVSASLKDPLRAALVTFVAAFPPPRFP